MQILDGATNTSRTTQFALKRSHRVTSSFLPIGMLGVMSGNERADTKVFAVCATTLYVKFLATTMIQGSKAFTAGTRAPEDNKLPMAKGQPSQSFRTQQEQVDDKTIKLAIDDEMRWKRIVQNDLESMPMAFVVFWGCIVVGGNQTATSLLLVLYTTARISHTLTFAHRMPRARMGSWMTGIACILGAGINGTIAAFIS
ncbi:hypothetical protein FI667_g900, partial [Globisporangium splendens]